VAGHKNPGTTHNGFHACCKKLLTWRTLLSLVNNSSVFTASPTTGSYLEEGLSQYTTSAPGGLLPLHKYKNRAASSMLLLRGQDAGA
jgi:hypothetical protein